jgi:hypothetical protein
MNFRICNGGIVVLSLENDFTAHIAVKFIVIVFSAPYHEVYESPKKNCVGSVIMKCVVIHLYGWVNFRDKLLIA